MRKFLVLAVVLFAMAFAFGFTADQTQAANCWYQCSCSGTPMKCCLGSAGVVCKVVFNAPFECPQRYDC